MSHRRLVSRIFRRSALSMLLMSSLGLTAHAASGTWTLNNNSNWGTTTSWTGGIVASGAGFNANFTGINITADRTVTNEAARSIGNIVFTDLTTSSHNFIIAGTNVLTLDVGINQSQINVTQAGRILTISAPLAGNDGVQKIGPGQLTLSGNNTISGNFLNDAGILVPASANALGTTTLIYNSGSVGTTAFTGGIAYANNITLLPGVVGTVGVGSIRHTGAGGVATLNGTISLQGVPGSGGTFGGSVTAGQELRINGAVNDATAGYSQRNGRVIYAGGGNSVGQFTITDTALLGANNGLPQGISAFIGGSSAAALNLNGFSQTINNTNAATYAMTIGNGGNAGTLELTTGTLTLNGDLLSGGSAGSTINSGVAGTLDWGAPARILQIDNTSANGLAINNATINGSGGITKNGTGNVTLNAATFNNALTFNTGTLRGTGSFNSGLTANTGTTINPGSVIATGSISASTLAIATGTQTIVTPITNLGANSSITVSAANGLTNAGAVTMQVNQVGGLIPNGTYNLINYTGTSPTLAGFTLAPVGHVVGSLVDSGSAIQYVVTGNDKVTWTGITDANWDTTTVDNWKTVVGNTTTTYIRNDAVVFGDGGLNTTINAGSTPLEPTSVEFTNTSTGPIYNISGTGTSGITGVTPITQTGNGSNVLNMPANTTTGAITVSAGTLEIRQATSASSTGLAGSPIAVTSPGTLRIIGSDATMNIARNITGNGTVFIDGNTNTGTVQNFNVNFTGDNSAFSGTLILGKVTAGDVQGSWRTDGTTSPADLGLTSTVQVQSGAQLWVGAGTFNNSITIKGVGSAEAAGGANATVSAGLATYAPDFPAYTTAGFSGIGAIRMSNNSIIAGTVTLDGSAKIGPFGATGTISGSVNTTNAADVLVVGGGTGANTLVLTGTNNVGANSLKRIWVGSGGTAFNQTLQIGNNSTTGTLGSGDVVLYGQSIAGVGGSATLDVRRSDGYTLDASQKIYAAINDVASTTNPHDANARPYQANVAVNSTGTGLTLGTGHVIDLSDATNNTEGAGFLRVGTAINGATLNINTGATVDVGYLGVGEGANVNATVNQAGADILVRNQLRVGHFGTETSTYNLTGGSINLNGVSPSLSPSTAAGGGNAAVGDNNINNLAIALVEGGGIYVGIDGRGIFNQSGSSTVSTNWVVLDNRGTTDTGTNMTGGGVDQYNLNGGTLNVKSTWGVIQRATNTAEFNLNGGTIRVDNSGTGATTGQANTTAIVVPLDTTINVSGIGSILDTNAGTFSGNGFQLTRNILGTGTVTTVGGGTVSLNSSALGGNSNQLITATIAGNSLISKDGSATSITSFLSPQTYTGATAVNSGILALNNSMATPTLTVADGAAVAGEPAIATVTLGTAVGSAIYFNPVTSGALTATTFTANGTTLVDFSAVPVGAGPFTVLNYTTNTTPGAAYALANAATFRGTPTVTDNAIGSIILNGLSTKGLTWAGTTATWDANTTGNWTDTATPGPLENFFSYDAVTFDDSVPGVSTTVTTTGVIQPASITVNSTTNNYTITGPIAGAGGITKAGPSTLTLGGVSGFLGPVAINGGTVVVTATSNLGSALPGNNISLNGGTLQILTNNINLGLARTLSVGAGGGTLSTANGRTQTISGPITGSAAALNFTGGGQFDLSGNNAGFSGTINVNSTGALAGATVLNLQSPISSTTVTLEASTISGAANTLRFNGLSLPATTNIVAKASNDGVSATFRSGLVSNAPGGAVNGSIQVEGIPNTPGAGSLVQFAADGSTTVSSLDINGPVTATMAGFGGTIFIRGSGLGRINNTINTPAGTLAKTDGGVWEINSTGNSWISTNVLNGTVRTTVANALPATAGILMGQNGTETAVLDLNGFNATASSLTSNPTTPGANTTGKSITSVAPATLTINQATNTTYASLLTGALSLVKSDVGTLTLTGTNTNTGTTTVSGGTLSLGSGAARGTSAINVGSGATVELNGVNIFVGGHGTAVDNARVVTVDGGTLLATAAADTRIGNITLTNGGTFTSNRTLAAFDVLLADTTTGAATITVSGTGAATMNGTGGIHLLGVQNFNVADTVAGSASDLNVSMILGNSGSQGANSPGGVNKLGVGTMALSAANTYTGGTTVSAGTLLVNNITGSGTGTGTVTVNASTALGGTGIISGLTTSAGTIIPGTAGVAGTIALSGGLTTNNGAFTIDLGTSSDLIDLGSGILTATGASTFTLNNLAGFAAGTYTLVDYGTLSGGIGNFMLSAPTLGGFNVALADNGSAIVLNVTSAGPSAWIGASGDNWTAATSWSGSVPNSASDEAQFTTTGGAIANLNVDQTVNKLTFNATTSNDYTISGPGKLTLAGTTPAISLAATNTGDQTITTNVELGAGTTITVSGGSLSLNVPTTNATLGAGVTATVATGATLNLGGAGNALSNGTTTHANVANNGTLAATTAGKRVGNITGTGTTDVTAASATLTATSIRQSVLSIGATSQATVTPSLGNKPAGISVFTNTAGTSLSIATGGNFDVNDNDLIVYYQAGQGATTLATIQQQIIDGFLGTPAVAKISSSTGAVDMDKFLVAIDNGGIGLTDWEGVSLTGTDQIIVKYTLFGDLNLDGTVDSFDYSVIDSNFGTGNSWLTGDSNLDGMVDSFDYSTVDTHFGKSFPMMGGGAGAGLSIAAIPEPSTFVLGGLAVLGLAGYRLRRRGLKTGAC